MTTEKALLGVEVNFDQIHDELSKLRSNIEALNDDVALQRFNDLEHASLVMLRRLRLHLGVPYQGTTTYEVSDGDTATQAG